MYKLHYNEQSHTWEPESITKIEAQNTHCQVFETLTSAAEAAEEFNQGNIVTCRDCGEVFSITAKEQKWYAEKGYKLPKRCPECRWKRRQAAQADKDGAKE